ncbi:MAG: hypothetical protein KAR31_07595 [Candidatus Omnitrophica bacterium]|nr:hypothetical protein [Candidatus Omnitrophota bacterium]MCK5179286.1 hypothetical protein [Candidatus Omnitrophota bacterium]
MEKKASKYVLVVLALSLFAGQNVYAGSKDMVASKRTMHKDDSTESMRDVYIRREKESKEYKEKMISNSEESIELLKEIRNLLRRLNEKK